LATKSVLIVDDAPETRIFLKGIVNSLGYSFFEAKTGLDALKILNDHAVDLVILDVMMPNYDGYQTMEFINKLKQKRNIKVAFFSGKKGDLDLEKIQELKPDDLIHKTVEIQVLKNKLKKLIEGTAAPFKLTIPSANTHASASSSSGEQQSNNASSASGGGHKQQSPQLQLAHRKQLHQLSQQLLVQKLKM
jgi:CheY-like chemotaxis protein